MVAVSGQALVDRVVAWDRAVMASMARPRGLPRAVLLLITSFGSAIVTLPLELLGWLQAAAPLSAWCGLCLLADVPGHLVAVVPLRYLTRRQRPDPLKSPIRVVRDWNEYSFPSAHSMRTWTIATILSLAHPSLALALFGAAAIVTGTRIPLRRHFPSDIIAGAAFGLLWGALMVALFPEGIGRP